MKDTISQAVTATGKNKATIQRAIKSWKISTSKNPSWAYEIDPTELHRVFPATAQRVAQHGEYPKVWGSCGFGCYLELVSDGEAKM